MELRDSSSRVRVGGFDLTFSAPKSVSVLFGVGDEQVREATRRAHDRAVREAVGYLERSAAAVRRGHGGARLERADGIVAAAFRHRTSRVGDPQLHTHVLVANLAKGPDGRWSALDARQIYAHARVASFVYQAVLRAELTRSLGVDWTPVRQGIAEVTGVPANVMRAFSRRRAEIVAALGERGAVSARAAEAAALATRRRKDSGEAVEDLVSKWRARAEDLGFPADSIVAVLGRVRNCDLDRATWTAIEAELAAPDGLTNRKSTFTRRDVLLAMCERLPPGAAVTALDLEAAAERFLASSRVVPLLPRMAAVADNENFRRRDGSRVPLAGAERRYSTPDLLALEQRLVDRVLGSKDAGIAVARQEAVDNAFAARPSLTDEQRVMVRELCLGGAGVAVVAGKAGTGKTFALAAAREAWEAAGYPVGGAAVARRAARELETGAGIPSASVAAVLARGPLPAKAVLVVDEAGMVGTRQLSALVECVDEARGKLILVGDHRQLPELEAGGAFRGLVRRGLAIELRENRRQIHSWERGALDDLRAGRAREALAHYEQRGRLTVAAAGEDVRDRLVKDWWTRGGVDDSVMIARLRVDVANLNDRARVLMRDAGALGREELRLPGGRFATGDRVVVRQNDLIAGVSNGDRVTAVDPAHRRLELDSDGRRVQLGPELLEARTAHGEPTLTHGYAITVHVSQGLTVGRAFVLADARLDREAGYVALSRGRDANHLYVADQRGREREEYAPADHHEQRGARERLIDSLSTSRAATLAIDSGQSSPARARVIDSGQASPTRAPTIDAGRADSLRVLEEQLAPERRRVEAKHREATACRRAFERSWRRRLPGGRGKLAELRAVEAGASQHVENVHGHQQALRRQWEREHAPPLDPAAAEKSAARLLQIIEERTLKRELDRGRDLGLGR